MGKKLGVIGGMGPMASQLFYKMVTEHTKAAKDQDHIEAVILSDSQMPDRTGAILSGETDAVAARMLKDAKILEEAGCSCIAVTCNTAHFFVDLVKDQVGIPFIHMIRETSGEMAKAFPGGKIGVMATDGTISTGLYQKALTDCGLTAFTPSPEVQKLVMHQIYDCIKAGKPYDAEAWKIIEKEYRDAGCSSVLLACTELSIIKVDENLEDWFVDPMMVLAKKSIEFCDKEYI